MSDYDDVIAWFLGGDDEHELLAVEVMRGMKMENERLRSVLASGMDMGGYCWISGDLVDAALTGKEPQR